MQVYAIAAAVLLAATGAADAATLFSCRMEARDRSNLISSRIVLRHDEAGQVAQVSDAVILAARGTPMPARIARDTGRSITFVWEIRAHDRQGADTTLQYRATFVRANKRVSLIARPVSLGERTTGSGICDSWPVR